jgi:hypothetical protein
MRIASARTAGAMAAVGCAVCAALERNAALKASAAVLPIAPARTVVTTDAVVHAGHAAPTSPAINWGGAKKKPAVLIVLPFSAVETGVVVHAEYVLAVGNAKQEHVSKRVSPIV